MPKVEAKLIFPADYSPLYSNGAMGGINVKGEIIINFFSEVHQLPEIQTYEVKENKLVELKQEMPDSLTIRRIVQTGVIMTPAAARELHDWLGRHLNSIPQLKTAETTKL